MMTVSEVAKLLNISRQSVYSIIEAGKLVVHRFGAGRGAIRVSEGDLQAYIAASRGQSVEPPPRTSRPKLKHLKL